MKYLIAGVLGGLVGLAVHVLTPDMNLWARLAIIVPLAVLVGILVDGALSKDDK